MICKCPIINAVKKGFNSFKWLNELLNENTDYE